jgi:hypothetical protein
MKAFLSNKKVILLFLGWVVLVQYLLMAKPFFVFYPGWPSHEVTVNYSYGFIRRGFIGTLVALMSRILPVDIQTVIWGTQLLGTLFLTVLLFIFFYYMIKHIANLYAAMIIILFATLGGIGFYFYNWGQLDIFMLSLTIVACFLIIRDKYLWLIPLLMGVCVMIHEGYVMMYFGIVMALLVYRSAVSTDTDKKKKYWLCIFSAGLVASALFVYFYFFSVSVSRVHIDEILANAEQILKIPLQTDNMKYIFARSALPYDMMWVEGKPTIHFLIRMIVLCMNCIVCLPVIILMIGFWKTVLRQTSDKKKKRITVLCLTFQLLTLPLVLLHSDQARWFYDIVYFNFLFISSVLCIGDDAFSAAAEKHFKPSIAKLAIFSFYFVIYLTPNLWSINFLYMEPAKNLVNMLIR